MTDAAFEAWWGLEPGELGLQSRLQIHAVQGSQKIVELLSVSWGRASVGFCWCRLFLAWLPASGGTGVIGSCVAGTAVGRATGTGRVLLGWAWVRRGGIVEDVVGTWLVSAPHCWAKVAAVDANLSPKNVCNSAS